MVKKRSRFMPGFQSRFMPAPRPLPSTRSSVRSTTFAPSFRRSYDDDFLYAPYRPSVLPHYSYDTSGSEYATASDINRELIMSSAAMEDNFDISNRSRQRDRDVLAAANRAIVDTEVHSTPKGAVAAMRVARGQSSPPAAFNITRTKAALLANKVEVDLPRRRTPRSSYAQARLREIRKSKQMDDVDAQPVAVAEVTSGLRAHAPVYDPTFGKPYWGVEGVRKPNIMSWQYRLDAYASPDDLIIVPRSLNAVRSQLRDAHEKLDHHKQLMDRYLVADKGFSVEDSIVLMNIKSQAPISEPASLNEAKKSDKVKKNRQKLMRKHQNDY